LIKSISGQEQQDEWSEEKQSEEDMESQEQQVEEFDKSKPEDQGLVEESDEQPSGRDDKLPEQDNNALLQENINLRRENVILRREVQWLRRYNLSVAASTPIISHVSGSRASDMSFDLSQILGGQQTTNSSGRLTRQSGKGGFIISHAKTVNVYENCNIVINIEKEKKKKKVRCFFSIFIPALNDSIV
jgi:hypothetical protein